MRHYNYICLVDVDKISLDTLKIVLHPVLRQFNSKTLNGQSI